jgi:hypothetical protein
MKLDIYNNLLTEKDMEVLDNDRILKLEYIMKITCRFLDEISKNTENTKYIYDVYSSIYTVIIDYYDIKDHPYYQKLIKTVLQYIPELSIQIQKKIQDNKDEMTYYLCIVSMTCLKLRITSFQANK